MMRPTQKPISKLRQSHRDDEVKVTHKSVSTPTVHYDAAASIQPNLKTTTSWWSVAFRSAIPAQPPPKPKNITKVATTAPTCTVRVSVAVPIGRSIAKLVCIRECRHCVVKCYRPAKTMRTRYVIWVCWHGKATKDRVEELFAFCSVARKVRRHSFRKVSNASAKRRMFDGRSCFHRKWAPNCIPSCCDWAPNTKPNRKCWSTWPFALYRKRPVRVRLPSNGNGN